MELTWLGDRCALARGKEARVVFDPPDGATEPGGSLGADLVVRSGGGTNVLRPGSGATVLAQPGEYEIHGVSCHGVLVDGGTAFVCDIDDVAVAAIGRGAAALSENALEALGRVDVLLLPVGGGPGLTAAQAAATVARVQPAVVVPVGYAVGEDLFGLEPLDPFAREMGLTQWAAQPRLTLTGSPGAGDDTRVVVLERRR
ncbi:MAG TPA: MBL fold metallo-hydrolase [Candidatus Micrarchaeia archaeon]|nr:MBL fold metallo-hydrolase [Candidatus Micrarchaeia archaeon]